MKPSVTIITRLRGIEKQSTNVKQQKAKTNFGLYAKKPTTPKNVSPVPKKEKCLLSETMMPDVNNLFGVLMLLFPWSTEIIMVDSSFAFLI